jgi:hypothetical protein
LLGSVISANEKKATGGGAPKRGDDIAARYRGRLARIEVGALTQPALSLL